ncbi:MAG: type II secretion system F family protein [Verrucomicrobia bacterium]|nr:type II secretion system F family protein [Verrucomicrobiota bacterium]
MNLTASGDLLLISGLWGLFATGVSAYCARMAGEITYITLSDGRRKERQIPFALRLLLPFARGMEARISPWVPTNARAQTDRKLTAAGFEGVISAAEFVGLRLLVPLVHGTLAAAFMTMLFTASERNVLLQLRLPTGLLVFLLAGIYPHLWLRGAIAERHRAIRRALPFVLDILTLSVEAGLDFMTALQRQVERSDIDVLNEELIRVIREIQLGKTRREALRDMSRRVDSSDLRSVVNALVQADELGVSIGTILRIQADQIRQRRFERAERLANEAPVKLLFPLLFFIFPSVFLILLGPILRQVFANGL